MDGEGKQEKVTPRLRFPGFKEPWAHQRMDALYTFQRNNSFSRDQLNYDVGTVKNIHYGDIHTKLPALFDMTSAVVPFINPGEAHPEDGSADYCVEGDVIFADASEDMNDVGKSMEVVRLNGEMLLSGQHTILARRKHDNIVVGFGGHLFRSSRIRSQIQTEAQGTKVYAISASRLKKIAIEFPTNKAEQQKIADCLTSLDEVIAAQGRKVESLKAHKRGLMQQLFPREGETVPRLRFPEFRDKSEWETKQIGDVFKVTRGEVLAMPLVSETKSDEKPYSVYSSQTKNRGLAGYYSEFLYEDAITWTTDGANAGDVNYRSGKFFCTNVCGVLISEDGFANTCVAELLNTVTRSHVSYVGNPKLMNGVMAKITIPFPDIDEQRKIADILASFQDMIDVGNATLIALKLHKIGLMQQLFPVLAATAD